jgi:hypothetical protein
MELVDPSSFPVKTELFVLAAYICMPVAQLLLVQGLHSKLSDGQRASL